MEKSLRRIIQHNGELVIPKSSALFAADKVAAYEPTAMPIPLRELRIEGYSIPMSANWNQQAGMGQIARILS